LHESGDKGNGATCIPALSMGSSLRAVLRSRWLPVCTSISSESILPDPGVASFKAVGRRRQFESNRRSHPHPVWFAVEHTDNTVLAQLLDSGPLAGAIATKMLRRIRRRGRIVTAQSTWLLSRQCNDVDDNRGQKLMPTKKQHAVADIAAETA
jgi:hypothetical protein